MKKSFFMAHGAPTIYLEDNPFTQKLKQFKHDYPEITKLVIMSAHYESPITTVSTATHYETMYDFGGFPKELYEVKMPTLGDPILGQQVIELLTKAGLSAKATQSRPLDHGAWTLLKLIDPENTLKVVLMSIHPFEDPQTLMRIGEALRGLDEQTAFIFSGGLVHNLGWLGYGEKPEPQALRFWTWLDSAIQAKDTVSLTQYNKQQDARLAVPRPEHFAGIFSVYGTMDDKGSVKLLSHMFQYGTLSLDYYEFKND
jgi:4,5-DOPA dioxygenase extradiol